MKLIKKKSFYSRKYRKHNFDNLLCIDCWKPLESNNLRLRCSKCSRYLVVKDIYRRWEQKLFREAK